MGVPGGRCSLRQRSRADAILLAARQSDGIRDWETGPEIIAMSSDSTIRKGPFRKHSWCAAVVHEGCAAGHAPPSSNLIEDL